MLVSVTSKEDLMIEIYGADWCTYCQKAKQYLDDLTISYTYIDVDNYPHFEAEFNSEIKSIPQIKINGEEIGGYDSLIKYVS